MILMPNFLVAMDGIIRRPCADHLKLLISALSWLIGAVPQPAWLNVIYERYLKVSLSFAPICQSLVDIYFSGVR
jgi:hypothetical protein